MGYNTLFFGALILDKELTEPHAAYLERFAYVRHMKREVIFLKDVPDACRTAAGLPLGPEGAYFTGSAVPFGQDYDHPSVLDDSEPPSKQPSLWCCWIPTKDRQQIVWNGQEKFYHYDEWLIYIIDNFLKPWGYKAEGTMRWVGEDPWDQGTLYVADNEVFVLADQTLEDLLKEKSNV